MVPSVVCHFKTKSQPYWMYLSTENLFAVIFILKCLSDTKFKETFQISK